MEKAVINNLVKKQVADFRARASDGTRFFISSDLGYQVIHSSFLFGANDEKNTPFQSGLPKKQSLENVVEIYRLENRMTEEIWDFMSESYDMGSKCQAVDESIIQQESGKPLPGILNVGRNRHP